MPRPVSPRALTLWYAAVAALLVAALLVGVLAGEWPTTWFLVVFAGIGLVTATSLWHAGRRLRRDEG